MIQLASPWILLLLPAPVLVWLWMPPYRQTVPGLRIPFFREITKATGIDTRQGSVVVIRSRLQIITAIFAWVLIVLALARPEWVGEPVEVEKSARDLVLAIDISGSMDDRDFLTETGERLQRLEAVKRIVGDFVEAREGDRVALIVFGSRAFLQSPFTEDLRTIRELLDRTEVGMAGPHTVLGDAIGLAIRTFESSDIKQRLLIVLSDGADTGSRVSPVNAAEIAARNGVEIHTVAVGTPDGRGENRVDVEALSDIAQRAGGQSFFANDTEALTAVYDRIDELAPRQIEVLSYRPRESVAHWFLGPAVILIVLVWGWMSATSSSYREPSVS